jgi:hypothetical protein
MCGVVWRGVIDMTCFEPFTFLTEKHILFPSFLSQEIFEAQAKAEAAEHKYTDAESHLLSAKKPEAAVRMYLAATQWDEALRVAKAHVQRLLPEVQEQKRVYSLQQQQSMTADGLSAQARQFEVQKLYPKAIDAYLKVCLSVYCSIVFVLF